MGGEEDGREEVMEREREGEREKITSGIGSPKNSAITECLQLSDMNQKNTLNSVCACVCVCMCVCVQGQPPANLPAMSHIPDVSNWAEEPFDCTSCFDSAVVNLIVRRLSNVFLHVCGI